jgi:hypothetical protein
MPVYQGNGRTSFVQCNRACEFEGYYNDENCSFYSFKDTVEDNYMEIDTFKSQFTNPEDINL